MVALLTGACMSSIESLSLDDDLFTLLLGPAHGTSSQWNGHKISLEEAFGIGKELQASILSLLFSQEQPSNQKHLARLEKSLIEKEIALLFPRLNDLHPRTRKISPPLQSPPPKHSFIYNILETIGRGLIDPELQDPNTTLLPEVERSRRFEVPGIKKSHCAIGGINGINTHFEGSTSHGRYLNQLSGGQNISWIHNQSHGSFVDLAEVVIANYLGLSPNTGSLLVEQWREFLYQNRNNPHAKFLQFCHSQGSIHVRNALKTASEEVRKRVIVVAIAPAVVVPKELCYDSRNYMSKKDVVHYGELGFWSALNSSILNASECLNKALQERQDIIWLDPHPKATGIDHDFQSPTYKAPIEERIKEYMERNGEYP